jgi:hypothetical protein
MKKKITYIAIASFLLAILASAKVANDSHKAYFIAKTHPLVNQEVVRIQNYIDRKRSLSVMATEAFASIGLEILFCDEDTIKAIHYTEDVLANFKRQNIDSIEHAWDSLENTSHK